MQCSNNCDIGPQNFWQPKLIQSTLFAIIYINKIYLEYINYKYKIIKILGNIQNYNVNFQLKLDPVQTKMECIYMYMLTLYRTM